MEQKTQRVFCRAPKGSVSREPPTGPERKRHAMKLVEENEAQNSSFTGVSADTYFAVVLMAKRQRKAAKALQAFLAECASDTNEFSALEIRKRLENIESLLLVQEMDAVEREEVEEEEEKKEVVEDFEEDEGVKDSLPEASSEKNTRRVVSLKNGHVEVWPPRSPILRPDEPELNGNNPAELQVQEIV